MMVRGLAHIPAAGPTYEAFAQVCREDKERETGRGESEFADVVGLELDLRLRRRFGLGTRAACHCADRNVEQEPGFG